MLGGQLAELVYALLRLVEAQIRGVGWHRIAPNILHVELLWLPDLVRALIRVDVENTRTRPNIPDGEGWGVGILRLRWILMVELLSVEGQLPGLALMCEACKVRELRDWMRLRHTRCNR